MISLQNLIRKSIYLGKKKPCVVKKTLKEGRIRSLDQ